MYYRCPLCEAIIEGSLNMARHLTDRHKFSVKHEEVLDSYILVQDGFVSAKGNVDEGATQPLMKLIEKG